MSAAPRLTAAARTKGMFMVSPEVADSNLAPRGRIAGVSRSGKTPCRGLAGSTLVRAEPTVVSRSYACQRIRQCALPRDFLGAASDQEILDAAFDHAVLLQFCQNPQTHLLRSIRRQ